MEVEAGKEGMKFEASAFSYYGVMALTASPGEWSPELSTRLFQEVSVSPVPGMSQHSLMPITEREAVPISGIRLHRSHTQQTQLCTPGEADY